MSYKIDKIRVHWGRMPVDLVFSSGRVSSFPFMIVRLYAGDAEGLGETTVPYEESMDRLLVPLLGADARSLDAAVAFSPGYPDLCVCEAISMALHDLVGRISGLPVHALLGGATRKKLPLMPCIFPNNPDEAKSKSVQFFSQGYDRYLKTKLIGDLNEDKARVKAIHSVAPEGLVLQGDSNCGYKTIPDARRAADELGTAGLDIFEDPLKGGVEEYRKLREVCCGAKIMVDDLARRTADLVSVLRTGAADVVGIHPVQPGSLSRAKQHAELARSFGVPVVIGGTGYSSVGPAAYQHLTAVVTPEGPCGELGGVFDHGMPRSLIAESLPMENGFVTLPDTPGLGVRLDEDAVAEFEQGRKEY